MKLDKGEILDCKGKNLQAIDVNLEDVVEDSENSDEEEIVNSQEKSFVIDIPIDDNIEVDVEEEDTSKKPERKINKTSKKSKKRNMPLEEHSEDDEKDVEQQNMGSRKTNITKKNKKCSYKMDRKGVVFNRKNFLNRKGLSHFRRN